MATDAERLQLMADYESLLKRMAECHITVPIVNTSAGQQSSSDGDRVLASGAGGSSSAAILTVDAWISFSGNKAQRSQHFAK